MKTNLLHYLSSVYFVNQPLHVSGVFVTHHQYVYCIYTQQLLCFVLFSWLLANIQSTEKHNTYHYLYTYIYSIPLDDGQQIYLKHVEVDWRNKLRINNASSWFSLHGQIFSHHSFFIFPSPLSFASTFSTLTSAFPSSFLFFFLFFFHAQFFYCYLLHLYIFTLLVFPSLLSFSTFLSQKWILKNCNIRQFTAMFLQDYIQIFVIVVLSYTRKQTLWPDLTWPDLFCSEVSFWVWCKAFVNYIL
jgi:hypothetical protein